MSPITLIAAEAYLTETRRTNTIATGVTSPPGPTLIITLTTTLTRYKHKRFFSYLTLIQLFIQYIDNYLSSILTSITIGGRIRIKVHFLPKRKNNPTKVL